MLTSVLTVIHLVAAISIVVLILLQQGRGADMGAAFGGGGSESSDRRSRIAVLYHRTQSRLYLHSGKCDHEQCG